jgi:hypothetical protein
MEWVDIATDQIGFPDGDEGDRLRPLGSAQAVAVHQDGIGGRGHPVERCRFRPGTKQNSTLCRPGRAAGILPLAKVRWRRLARRGGRAAIMAEVLQCHVFARPDFAMGGPHGGGGPHGTPLRLGTRSRHGRRAPRGALLRGGRQRQIRARCHRTVLAYWKFESISLQRGVSNEPCGCRGRRTRVRP